MKIFVDKNAEISIPDVTRLNVLPGTLTREAFVHRRIIPMMFALFVILFLHCINCEALERSDSNSSARGLHNHSEIHEAKNLIDALSFKLHLNLQKYENKYESLQIQSKEYLAHSDSAKEEIKTLNKLKDLLNDVTKKSSICEKFYANFDFTVARQIMINSSASLPKDYTVAVQGTSVIITASNSSFCLNNTL